MDYRMRIKDLPKFERPYEKLAEYGAEILSDAELLAVIIRTGTRSETSVQLAQRLLKQDDTGKGLSFLNELSPEELKTIKGIGSVKAYQIKAVMELAKRIASHKSESPVVIKSPRDISDLLMEEMRYLKQETVRIVMLNTKNHVQKCSVVSIGGLNQAVLGAREIFVEPLKKGCSAVILVHNHPSGDPTPSKEDMDVSQRLVSAGKMIGIDVLDHVIIGDGRYISLKEKGLF